MPKQIITIEVSYQLLDENNELREPPEDWDIEAAFDHYADCVCCGTETLGVRLIQSSPPVYGERDRTEAAEAEYTLLELGILE